MSRLFIAHEAPVWADRVDYYIHADLDDVGMPERCEQLPVRRVAAGRYEICCLPFYPYGLALGDVVSAMEHGSGRIVVDGLVLDRGERLVRIAFANRSSGPEQHAMVDDALEGAGFASEWHGAGYASIRCADAGQFPILEAVLAPWQRWLEMEVAK